MLYSAIILASFVLIAVVKIKIAPRGVFYDDYLSVGDSNNVRALMAICILISHFSYTFENKYLLAVISPFAYIFVGAFLFYTGYGLLFSYYSKENYLKGFLKKRLFSILLPFYLIVGIDCIYNAVVNNVKYSFLYIFEALYNNWYVLIITITYLLFFACLKLKFKDKKSNEILFLVLFVFISIIIAVISKKGFYLYSMLSLPLGMLWFHKKDSIERLIRKKWFLSIVICVISLIIFIALRYISGSRNLVYIEALSIMASTPIFTLLIFVLLNKIKIGNRILTFIGNISYEVYLCHRFIMDALFKYEEISSNMLLYFCIVIIITIFISVIVYYINTRLLKALRIK